MVGVFCFDEEGRFISINSAGLAQISCSLDYAVAMLRPWDIKPAFTKLTFWRFVEPRLGIQFATVHQGIDGKYTPVSIVVHERDWGFEARAHAMRLPRKAFVNALNRHSLLASSTAIAPDFLQTF